MRFGISVKSFRIIAVFVCLSLVPGVTGCKGPGPATQPGTVQEGTSPTGDRPPVNGDQSGTGSQSGTGDQSGSGDQPGTGDTGVDGGNSINASPKILSEQEDPDYDLFFRTFARQNAELRDENNTRHCLEAGYLPGKLKINYVLGQFDKFYEIYDIDENSPYFVPEEDRIKAL